MITTKILVGVQVPPETEKAFQAAEETLAGDYVFTELTGDLRKPFDMFIS